MSERDDLLAKLGEPFPDNAVKERKGGGGQMLRYIAGDTIIRRLNHAAGAWDFRIQSTDWRPFGADMLVVVVGELTIPGLGSRAGIGVQVVRERGGEDLVKGAQCVPLRSRILTREGFKRFDEVQVGEDVLAYDCGSDRNVWTPLRAVNVYEGQPVVALTNSWAYRLECTPDHKWAVRPTANGRRPLLRPANAFVRWDQIVMAAESPEGASPLTPSEAAIIGWLFTDGTVRTKPARERKSPTGRFATGSLSAVIYQSKPEGIAAIRELLGGVATETVEQCRPARMPQGTVSQLLDRHKFRLPTALVRDLFAKADIETDTDLPGLATRLTGEARQAMFSAMMLADGTKRGTFGKKRRPGVMEAWRVLCAMQGIAVGPLQIGSHDMPRQTARKTRHMSVSQIKQSPVGLRTVWCPTTDFGTWVMEQDGTVIVTGNTDALKKAAVSFGVGLELYGPDLEAGEVATTTFRPQQRQQVQQAPWESAPGASEAPRSSPPDTRPGEPRAATDAQRNFITKLLKKAEMDRPSANAWCADHGFTAETMSASQASSFIDYLKPLAGFEEREQ